MPCKQGESADVKGSECLGKRIRAAARINVGGRAYYCGREAALLRPPARNRVLHPPYWLKSGLLPVGETKRWS